MRATGMKVSGASAGCARERLSTGTRHRPDHARPTVKVNPRTGGTCGGLAQPKGTGRSWDGREATAGALSSGFAWGSREAAYRRRQQLQRRPALSAPSHVRQPHAGAQLGPAPPTCAPPRAPCAVRGAVLARPSGREPSAQPGGLRGGGGLGAGEVWATVGSAAIRSQVEAGGPGGGRTGLRTPPGPLPLCRVLSPGKGLLSGMGASPTAPAGACTAHPQQTPSGPKRGPGTEGREKEVDVLWGEEGGEAWRRLNIFVSPLSFFLSFFFPPPSALDPI